MDFFVFESPLSWLVLAKGDRTGQRGSYWSKGGVLVKRGSKKWRVEGFRRKDLALARVGHEHLPERLYVMHI